jgi:integrase
MSIYRQKGRKTYMMDFVFKGHRVYETTGEQDKRRAQRVHDQRLNELRDGAAGVRKKQHQYFLGAAAEEWRAKPRKHPWSPSMVGIVDGALKRVIPAFGEDRLLADIEAEDIATYQRARLAEAKRPSNRTVNMEIGVLRKILIHTGHWPRLREDVHMLQERTDVGKALTPDQERLLLAECGRSVSRALLPFVTLAIDTGARYDTIRTLQWGRVDLEKGFIKIGKDKTAAGTGRTVPLNVRALQTVRHWAAQFPERKPEYFVFPVELYGLRGEKGKFGGTVKVYKTDLAHPVGTIQSAWETAKRRTQRHCPQCTGGTLKDHKPKGHRCDTCKSRFDKLPEALSTFRFHDLRHTAVSRMIEAGQPLPIIAKVVGWRLSTVVEMAERYGHFEQDALRRAVEAIAAPSTVPGESTVVQPVSSQRVQ